MANTINPDPALGPPTVWITHVMRDGEALVLPHIRPAAAVGYTGYRNDISDTPSFVTEGICIATGGGLFTTVDAAPWPSDYDEVPPLAVDTLGADQQQAYDVVLNHLLRTIKGERPRQLLMIVHGAAGTGKTTVIDKLSVAFRRAAAEHILVKTSPSGTAAGLIGGQTLPSIASSILAAADTLAAGRNTSHFARVQYVFIDQYARLSKTALAQLSLVLSNSAEVRDELGAALPFGGRNVVLFGDLLLCEPDHNIDALYRSRHTGSVSHFGATIFARFNTVVTLRSAAQRRDHGWRTLMDHVRVGQCSVDDLALLQSLLLRDGDGPEFSSLPAGPTLLTNHLVMARVWNEMAFSSYCVSKLLTTFLIPALETRGTFPNLPRFRQNSSQRPLMPYVLELALGMRVRAAYESGFILGTVESITPDAREPSQHDGQTVRRLLYPPISIVVSLQEDHRVLLDISRQALELASDGNSSPIIRQQFPVFPAYALTEVEAEGLTFCPAVIDLAKPNGLRVTAREAYALLSRVDSPTHVRILREFDASGLRSGLDNDVVDASRRLEALSADFDSRHNSDHLFLSAEASLETYEAHLGPSL